ncbi:MAG: HIT domain-containing protein [Chloroflexi bacterium]|nr:HIT domain-containing protein [Chloroflexota bacterium]MDA1174577.1 HIT domain-containing protein [Chloroflexota bacterium]
MTQAYFADHHPNDDGSCDFCGIISGREARTIRYEDDDLMVFKNQLTWVPVMLLVVPKIHLTQQEFWRSPLFAKAAALAVEIAQEDAPDGFRFVSNFGEQAAQTQAHGHLHILGGGEMGLYMDFPRKGDYWLRRFGTTEGDAESRQRREDERKKREARQADAPTQDEQR